MLIKVYKSYQYNTDFFRKKSQNFWISEITLFKPPARTFGKPLVPIENTSAWEDPEKSLAVTVAVPENAHIKMEIEDPDFVENRNIPGIPEENFEQALDRFEAGMRPEGSEDENQNQDQQENEQNQILHEVPFYRDETGRKSMGHVPLIQVDTLKNHMDRYPKTKPTCMSIIYRYFFFLVNLFFIILGIIAIGFGIYGVIRVRVDGLDDPILICTDPAFVSLVLGRI